MERNPPCWESAWSAHVNVVWNGRRISRRRSRSSWFMFLGRTSSIVVGCCGGSRATASTSTSVVWLGRRVTVPPPWSNVTTALCCRNKSHPTMAGHLMPGVRRNSCLTATPSIHGAFLGSLDCTRKSYIPPCTGKFALSESTVRKFGKIFIFPLYYLIHFSRWKRSFGVWERIIN